MASQQARAEGKEGTDTSIVDGNNTDSDDVPISLQYPPLPYALVLGCNEHDARFRETRPRIRRGLGKVKRRGWPEASCEGCCRPRVQSTLVRYSMSDGIDLDIFQLRMICLGHGLWLS